MGVSIKLIQKFWDFVKYMDEKRIATLTFPDGVKEYTNISYRDDGKIGHLLDIYRPEGVEGKLPVIIDVHGGGWMYGYKDLNKHFCYRITKMGFAVVNMSYCLFPEVTVEEPIQDIFKVLNTLPELADQYGLDLNNVFMTGDSAGGHYTALVASCLADKQTAKLFGVKTKQKLNAIALTCPALSMDFMQNIKLAPAQEYVRMFVGRKDYINSPLFKSLSIKNNKVENFPPMMLNTCDGDFLQKESLEFCKLLDEKGVPYKLINVKKADQVNKLAHVYNIGNPDWQESVMTNEAICAFFREHIVG